MNSNNIRKKFLAFFETKGHAIIPSSSLLPDDPTTLFTGSGMQPLLPYLLGTPHPLGKRLANSQKSLRAQDIEEVGDNRHTTFFEMLGNWSLGDYFKKEQIYWMFEFVTQVLKLDPNRLYVSCFRGNSDLGIPRDEESAKLWEELLTEKGIDAKIVDFPEKNGLQGGRIFYYSEEKNWWSRFGPPQKMPINEPGGPDSEMFWDFGANLKLHENSPWRDEHCHINCDCGRFMEIGNNVFMEYVKTANGFEKLAQQNVDFGGGLERMKAAMDDNPDIFLTDLFDLSRKALEEHFGKKYGESPSDTKAFRIIMDHIRASVFLIADGVEPSNIERGYILRRLLRRASRYAHILGSKPDWYNPIIQAIIKTYSDTYPELTKSEEIRMVIANEYEKFEKALSRGLAEFEKIINTSVALSAKGISGQEAFNLYQSYGFPVEMIEELAREKNITIDRAGFDAAFKKHQEVSRAGQDQKFGGHGLAKVSDEEASRNPDTWKMTRLHTATHLLHQALRNGLGEEVRQMGSDINPERARFDFTFSRKLTAQELALIEEEINHKIKEGLAVTKTITSYQDAISSGALAFFKEKYPATVSVYSIGNYSKELCGGPHVSNTNQIGQTKILKEESVSSGVRRIRIAVK